jgi:hypothetical protein
MHLLGTSRLGPERATDTVNPDGVKNQIEGSIMRTVTSF